MSSLLDLAIAHHRCGRLDAAESGYRSLLAIEPDHDDALHLLGVALSQKGRQLEGLRWIDQAIDRRPEIAAYHGARGEVLRELGRDDEAAVALRLALDLDPSLATAHSNLGLVHLANGRGELAVASFDEAIRLRPDFNTARINRGEALAAIGHWGEAAAAYGEALASEPNNAWVHTYLGYALVELGDIDRLDEAALHCRRAIELAPGLAHAHTNLGTVLMAMDKPNLALASYHRAVALDPGLAMPWNNIGRAEQERGRYDAAFAAYQKALELAPCSARFHANLAGLLVEHEREVEGVERYQLALECDPALAEAHDGMASALSTLGRSAEARSALEQAIRLRPRMASPRMGMARLLAEDGEFDASIACARTVIEDHPHSAEAYFLLATKLRDRFPDEDLHKMLALIEHPYYNDHGVACLAFGIAMVLDGRGRYSEAAPYFQIANARQAAFLARRGQSFDADHDDHIVAQIITSFTPEFFQAVGGRGSPSRLPIFVVGMPRSGTTLTEQVLASHPRVFGAGELSDVMRLVRRLAGRGGGPPELTKALVDLDAASVRACADEHLARLRELGGAAEHVVDKMPMNTYHLGLIAALWPGATIIVCRRDPRDVALSCWTTYFGAIRWANDLRVIARQIINHDRLLAHWKAVLPIPMIEVVYEDMVVEFEPQARRLVEALGLPWDPACLNFHSLKRPIRTASLGQVRQPIYSKSVGRWKHYEAALAPLLDWLCEPAPASKSP